MIVGLSQLFAGFTYSLVKETNPNSPSPYSSSASSDLKDIPNHPMDNPSNPKKPSARLINIEAKIALKKHKIQQQQHAQNEGSENSSNNPSHLQNEGSENKEVGILELCQKPNLAPTFAMYLALFTGYSCLLTILPLHATQVLGLSPQELGLMFSLPAILGVVGAPLGGWIADRFGRRMAIMPAAVCISLGAGLLAQATTLTSFGLPVLLWGLGMCDPI